MIKISKILILNVIFLSFTILATGCFESTSHSALFGQPCSMNADCALGLTCVAGICHAESADAWMLDTSSEIPLPDVEVTDAESSDVVQLDAVGSDARAEDISSSDVEIDVQCCAGGCGEWAVCSDCICELVDLDSCRIQGQRCDNIEESRSDYYCEDIADGQPGYCVLKCDWFEDSICPDLQGICNPLEIPGGGYRVCQAACTIEEGCERPDFGCMPVRHDSIEGICMFIENNSQIGETCESLLSCVEGGICRGGICVQACEVFGDGVGGGTDCDQGHCMPVTRYLGSCMPDIEATREGDECSDEEIGLSCGTDALMCFYSDAGGNQCTRICAKNEDCRVGERCGGSGPILEHRRLGKCVADSE